jgi:hypothetical protein
MNTVSRHCEERQLRINPFFLCGSMDCFAALAMTETAIDRHPEVAASSAALEGRRHGSVILRGSQGLAPQDDEPDARERAWLQTLTQAA